MKAMATDTTSLIKAVRQQLHCMCSRDYQLPCVGSVTGAGIRCGVDSLEAMWAAAIVAATVAYSGHTVHSLSSCPLGRAHRAFAHKLND
jgi:hypothetical protein